MKAITIDKKLLDKFESLPGGTMAIRAWKPNEEQKQLISKYWAVKKHEDFIAAFVAIYPDAPRSKVTYLNYYRKSLQEAK